MTVKYTENIVSQVLSIFWLMTQETEVHYQ
jgi:hypothetical protein